MIVLTLTMIIGVIMIVWVIVTRMPQAMRGPPALPPEVALPEGSKAIAFTQGPDWYAVVTDTDQILIFDRTSGALRQTVTIAPPAD